MACGEGIAAQIDNPLRLSFVRYHQLLVHATEIAGFAFDRVLRVGWKEIGQVMAPHVGCKRFKQYKNQFLPPA